MKILIINIWKTCIMQYLSCESTEQLLSKPDVIHPWWKLFIDTWTHYTNFRFLPNPPRSYLPAIILLIVWWLFVQILYKIVIDIKLVICVSETAKFKCALRCAKWFSISENKVSLLIKTSHNYRTSQVIQCKIQSIFVCIRW